jgi:DNA-binding transcriptional MocR family regulator
MMSSPFIIVEHDTIEDLRISGEAFRLYCYYLKCAGNRDVAYPSQKTLAEKFGVSERTIRERISELKAIGLIRVERRGDGKQANIHLDKPTYATRKKEGSDRRDSAQSGNSDRQNISKNGGSDRRDSSGLYKVEKETAIEKETAATCARTHETDDRSSEKARQPDTQAAAVSSDFSTRKNVALPADTSLLDIAPEILERVSPEVGLPRFLAEFPEHKQAIDAIAHRADVKYPRVVQWKEARAKIAEEREKRQTRQAAAMRREQIAARPLVNPWDEVRRKREERLAKKSAQSSLARVVASQSGVTA